MSFQEPPDRILPPAEIDCKWWKQGYCYRGKKCYFRHDEAMAGDHKKPDTVAARLNGSGQVEARLSPYIDREESSAIDASPPPPLPQICTICLETPDTYGLLLNCDHIFCLECIRDWRSSNAGNSNDELKDATKTCPLCRSHSEFIIPSSQFPTPSSTENRENTVKKEIVDRYLSRLKNIPCRYFDKSVEDFVDSEQSLRPKCKFGNGCHYSHQHPATKEQYIFSEAELNRGRSRPRRRRPRYSDEEIAMMDAIINALGGGGFDSDEDLGCDDEDLSFFESGSIDFSFGHGLEFDEFEHNYGWD